MGLLHYDTTVHVHFSSLSPQQRRKSKGNRIILYIARMVSITLSATTQYVRHTHTHTSGGSAAGSGLNSNQSNASRVANIANSRLVGRCGSDGRYTQPGKRETHKHIRRTQIHNNDKKVKGSRKKPARSKQGLTVWR